jgi:glutamine synthetase
MFLGDELTEILEALETGADYHNKEKNQMEIGATVLPHFPKDTTDRNRTSPFAFTGNKFEFRMLGSMFSIAGPNIILNTSVAEVLRQFADVLEESSDFTKDMAILVRKVFTEHKRLIFNGNNYSDEWRNEAQQRGLSNLKTTVDALPEFVSPKSIELFTSHQVFTDSELHSRYEILMEGYCKTLHIEALTMVDMVKGGIIPASISYQNELSSLLEKKKVCGGFDITLEEHSLGRIAGLSACLLRKLTVLENVLLESGEEREIIARARYYRDQVFTAISELRLVVDELETLVAKKYWPMPSYADLLYSVV